MSEKSDNSEFPGRRDDDALDALSRSLADDVLSEDYPIEAVDAELRELGADPEAVAARGRSIGWIELERGRRSWMARARDKLDAARQLLRKKADLAGLGRDEILDRIRRIQTDPSLAAPMAAAFRKRTAARASDDELRELLAEMELLRELAERERNAADGEDDGEDGGGSRT